MRSIAPPTAALAFLALAASTGASQSTRVVDFADAVESAIPAVVTVATTSVDGPEEIFGFTAAGADAGRRDAIEAAYRRSPDLSNYSGSGSGFVVRRGGRLYVVTNAHVIQSAGTQGEIAVFSVNQTEYRMRLVGADTYRDVAVLAFEDNPGSELSTLEIHTGDLRLGSPVFAIGNPLGMFPYSVSSGVIGGLNRSLTGFTGRDGYLQTDAAIIWGNSGGPLIDGSSRVVGLNTRIHLVNRDPYAFAVPQLNFALEGRYLARIVDDIIRDGRFQRAYLGGIFQQGARRHGGPTTVTLAAVVDGSPAARQLADHVGAQLVAIDGELVTDAGDVNGLFERVRPNTTVRLTFAQGNQRTDVSVRTGVLGDDEASALGRFLAREILGVSFAESGDGLRVVTGPRSRPSHMSLHGSSSPPSSGDVLAVTGYYHPNGSTFWRTATLREFAVASRLVMPTGWLGIWLMRGDDVYVADAQIPPTAAI